uniref:G-protein coupled receptors family 1 profile domain-containing protein n=1 Tax=Panagrolaimus davidi TaxID=227884 RepID=A0A914P4A0_9BILA
MITIKQNALMEIVIMMPLMAISILLSLLIFEKIRRMKILASEGSTESNTLNDIRRAAFVCVVQPLGFIVYNILIFIGESIYIQISSMPPVDVPDSSVKSYLIISTFYPFVYLAAMLVDTFLMLFSLKTYRRGVILIWNNILNKETTPSPIQTLFTKTAQTRNGNTFVSNASHVAAT